MVGWWESENRCYATWGEHELNVTRRDEETYDILHERRLLPICNECKRRRWVKRGGDIQNSCVSSARLTVFWKESAGPGSEV